MTEFKNIKFVIMTPSPLTSWWLETLCTDEMSLIFDFEYWDCSPIAVPSNPSDDVIVRPYVKSIRSFECLKMEIKLLPADSVLLTEVHFVETNFYFYKIISRYIRNIVTIDIWTFTIKNVLKDVKSDDTSSQKQKSKKSIVKKILTCSQVTYLRKFLKYGFSKEYWDFCSVMRQRRFEKRFVLYEKKIVRMFEKCYLISWDSNCKNAINLPDYDKYLRIRNEEPLNKGRYILYLDQGVIKHPDHMLLGDTFSYDNEAVPFYSHINNYFDYLEHKYDCKVIIAAHPRSVYSVYNDNPFNGREIVFFKTAELIRDSYAVCGHCSNSYVFVLLFEKPYAIIVDETFRKMGQFYDLTNEYSRLIDYHLIHLDNPGDYNIPFKQLSKEKKDIFMKRLVGNREVELNYRLFERNILEIHEDIVLNLKLKK